MSLPSTTARLSLDGFAKFQAALVREMESYGWTGRIGKAGHAFMFAPDGVTTCSVPPKEGSRRARGNNSMIFKSWLKQMQEMSDEAIERAKEREVTDAMAKMRFASRFQPPTAPIEDLLHIAIPNQIPERAVEPAIEPAPAPVDTEPERTPSEFQCPLCDREFAGRQPLSVHHVRAHVRVPCPVCDRQLAPGNLPRHQRKYHPERSQEELQREVHQLRQEVTSWQALAEEAEEAVAEMTRLGVEAEGRYAELRERYNAVVEAANALHNVIAR